LLEKDETDLCHQCRKNSEQTPSTKTKIPFVAQWTALWYYKEDVRNSIHRFKFRNRRHYANAYGRLLALRLSETAFAEADFVTWVPVSALRRLRRGYDQSRLLAVALGNELSLPVVHALKKIRHTPPQSTLGHAPQRRANVLGAYKAIDTRQIIGKRILLLDDVITTGATASECAKVLLTAGAKEVILATVAVAKHDKK
jgi:ComF family protein